MKIHVPTKTIFKDDSRGTAQKKAYLKYRELTGKAEPIESLDFTVHNIYPFADAVVGADQRRTETLVENGGVYSYEVVDLTAEEIADEFDAYKAAKLAQVRYDAAAHIATLYKFEDNNLGPITSSALYQASVANGLDTAPDSYYTDVAAVKVESNRAEALIEAATEKNEVDLYYFGIVWPTLGGA